MNAIFLKDLPAQLQDGKYFVACGRKHRAFGRHEIARAVLRHSSCGAQSRKCVSHTVLVRE